LTDFGHYIRPVYESSLIPMQNTMEVEPEWSFLMDVWLFIPFTLGFFFFRSKAGMKIEEYCMRMIYGGQVSSKEDGRIVDSDHFVAVRSELRQIRQEILVERRGTGRLTESTMWHQE
jgi:hypothetical protein